MLLWNKSEIFQNGLQAPECIYVSENNEEISECGLECCRKKVLSNEDLGFVMVLSFPMMESKDTFNNPDEVNLLSTEWTSDNRDLYVLITRSQVCMRDLEMFFGTKPLNVHQSAVGAQLMIEVYKEVVKSVADLVQEAAIRQPIHFDDLIMQAFEDVIGKYIIAGAGQFIQEYRRAHRLKETADHCKCPSKEASNGGKEGSCSLL
ncbi:hypothetical protein AWC38_SpisGene23932 [Stylophora pistillata]|uniref:Uncharacterized protein n=1 Tax=Stylophora pistillata TaxID=50429 RepID=A0A2B4R1A5_STYPI|nr:hypothetical protein AWC38_SpisGene23932 [Stylophora pistillata]